MAGPFLGLPLFVPSVMCVLWCLFCQAAKQQGGAATRTLIGSSFVRLPADATPRYATWLNTLTQPDLMNQRFREVVRLLRILHHLL